MKKINHIKGTIGGIVFIVTAIFLLVKNITTDHYIISFLLVAGLLLVFVPDKFINRLEKIILGKEIEIFQSFKDKDKDNG